MNQSHIDAEYTQLMTALYRGKFDPNEWRKFIELCRLHGFERDADTAEKLCEHHIKLNNSLQQTFEGCSDWYAFRQMLDKVKAR